VILIDANLLLYAYNPSFERHAPARQWLEDVLSRPEPVRLTWITLLAFLRIGTNPRAFEHPMAIDEAVAIVSTWLDRPMVGILEPGDRHWEILAPLLATTPVRGAMVMDAELAAIAIEHGAILHTTDRDFSRFAGLHVVNPLR
jgi:toxin-antitoxin system PIN domain toxin